MNFRNSTFGQITTSRDARIMQFALEVRLLRLRSHLGTVPGVQSDTRDCTNDGGISMKKYGCLLLIVFALAAGASAQTTNSKYEVTLFGAPPDAQGWVDTMFRGYRWQRCDPRVQTRRPASFDL